MMPAARRVRPNPDYRIPAPPGALARLPSWLRGVHVDWVDGNVSPNELRECREMVASLTSIHRAKADLRRARAAERAAMAQERMADVLASFEYGGAAVALLARLREMPGETRPLSFRRVPAAISERQVDGA